MANPTNSPWIDPKLSARDIAAADLSGEHTNLPAGRAFVVQLSDGSAVADNRFAGRVEHISSGQRRVFHSLPELVAFISQTVVASETPRRGREGGSK